uniref:CRISPR-associated protein, Csd1 family n=1 Tax=Candidatus Kentrum sp. TUN TaxID=2126343 RepID=A0A450ZVG8_9GAMM|nr:MAG: CRISPR-associated protein, Csd1 family [Candidatus Kentron sp. TUN]
MGWMQDLFETYENCQGKPQFDDKPLDPICHTTQQAHIEIVIDGEGNFRDATVIEAKEDRTTLIPCTESSGGRSGSKPIHHPLCDKLQYIAADYTEFGGEVTSGFAKDPSRPHRDYQKDLQAWVSATNPPHPMLNAIHSYVKKGEIIHDLAAAEIIPLNTDDKFLKSYKGDKDDAPDIFKVLPTGQSPENAFVRWRVEIPDNPESAVWENRDLIDAWISHYAETRTKEGLCFVTGNTTTLAEQHPAKLRHAADKAKLISSNDTAGYTFRGRFLEADEAAGVGIQVTQKAHNALRWLVARQGYRNGDQVIVAWSMAGKPVPDPFENSMALFRDSDEKEEINKEPSIDIGNFGNIGDAGQVFSLRLKKVIRGYRAKLDPRDHIIVMAMDAATPGRMAAIFYRKLKGSEFLGRIENWHTKCAWPQNFGKNAHFIGAPAPRDIAESAYGRRLDDKLRKTTVERLLPCIVDGQEIPRDLVTSTVRRTSNRIGFKANERWEWEKCLGIACALFKGHHQKENYQMALEEDRKTRDYLYGRLLAIAENIEGMALHVANEGQSRDTMAARLMHRFADRPFSTWKNIELALAPYKSRLRVSREGFLRKREKLLDEVMALFVDADDFMRDSALSGEFLIGYHCQRQKLRLPKSTSETGEATSPMAENGSSD